MAWQSTLIPFLLGLSCDLGDDVGVMSLGLYMQRRTTHRRSASLRHTHEDENAQGDQPNGPNSNLLPFFFISPHSLPSDLPSISAQSLKT